MIKKADKNQLLKFASIFMSTLIISSASLQADTISSDLGPAGPAFYALFILSPPNGNTMNVGGSGTPSTIYGNAGISGSNTLILNPSSVIRGNVSVDSGNGATFTNQGTVTGTISNPNLTSAASAANSAYSTFTSLAATQTIGSIGGNTTINNGVSAGSVNVIDISGAISLGIGQTLTINGAAGSEFIIDVAGSISLNNADVNLTGGVTSNDVVFATPGQIHLSNNSILNGILMNVNGAPTSIVSSIINGELIANSSAFTFTNSSLNAPEPGTYATLGACLAIVFAWRLGRKNHMGCGPSL